jgi:hypothetical protein
MRAARSSPGRSHLASRPSGLDSPQAELATQPAALASTSSSGAAGSVSVLVARSSASQHDRMWTNEDSKATVLTRQECLELLSQVSVGSERASIPSGHISGPLRAIWGVGHFRPDPPTKLDAATIGAGAPFQANVLEEESIARLLNDAAGTFNDLRVLG